MVSKQDYLPRESHLMNSFKIPVFCAGKHTHFFIILTEKLSVDFSVAVSMVAE